MAQAAEQIRTSKQTTLQRTLTDVLNGLGVDAALVAIYERDGGPLVSEGFRGFTPREAQTILRTLSGQDSALLNPPSQAGEGGSLRTVRVRMITPAAKSLLAVPLKRRDRVYGILVIGRKEGAAFVKKERSLIESASEEITGALERASLFDGTLVLSRPLVAQEPVSSLTPAVGVPLPSPPSYATPEIQEQIGALLGEAAKVLPFDRAWVTCYDPIAGTVEVLGIAGEQKGEHKRDLKPGLRLALDASASGWAVRHKKPRVDNDLASTQGRFLDHKHLYKDRFRSALVVPFFVRGQVGGTVTLASKTPMQYGLPDARVLEPLIVKLVELLQEPPVMQTVRTDGGTSVEPSAEPSPPVAAEPLIRKQERQAALGEFSAFLATEVREPLASIRAQLEEVTGEGILDFDPQTRVESAMRDLIRVEAILNEILDFAKPLELNRRLCRVPDIIENALTVAATDLEMNRIRVTKDYAAHLGQARCDEAKLQQVFLSIFKNALEAMSPGGHLHIEVAPHKSGRIHDIQILIKNDGVPIPTEHVARCSSPSLPPKGPAPAWDWRR
jgi:signal transduction histidine kinase